MGIDSYGICTAIIILFFTSLDAGATCRSPKVKHKFDVEQGYPHGRKGYVVDHTCALFCGGRDVTANMQYQTIAAGKRKDRWETTPLGCNATCTPQNSTPKREVFNCK
jgi:hypothetical protein